MAEDVRADFAVLSLVTAGHLLAIQYGAME
jgi:hypothetical protein